MLSPNEMYHRLAHKCYKEWIEDPLIFCLVAFACILLTGLIGFVLYGLGFAVINAPLIAIPCIIGGLLIFGIPVLLVRHGRNIS